MTSFELGFLKYAQECGLSLDRATRMLKRSSEYPGTTQMFKNLPKQEEDSEPGQLDVLANLLKQDLIDQHMGEETRKIQL
jgi:hypothetical protein